MASFPPFKKSLFRIITVITIICLLVISCTIPASAYSNDKFPNKNDFPSVNIPISRPQLNGNTVYAEILTKYGDGTDYRIMVFIFTVSGSGSSFTCYPKIVDGNHIEFEFYYDHDSFGRPALTCYYYDSNSGFLKYKDYSVLSSGDRYYSIITTQNYGIYGAHYYGMIVKSQSVPSVQKEFIVNYATEGLIVNYLNYFKDTFGNSLSAISTSIQSFNSIFEVFRYQLYNYFNSSTSYLERFEGYLDLLTKQNQSMINGSPGSDEDEEPPPEEVSPPRNDSTVDDIKEAEKDAVGGKTDEEIKEDIEDTLDFEDKKDEVNGEEIETSDIEVSHNTFNLVFDFMGGAWNSYFILSLTIAFAAFLIGRRY